MLMKDERQKQGQRQTHLFRSCAHKKMKYKDKDKDKDILLDL